MLILQAEREALPNHLPPVTDIVERPHPQPIITKVLIE
ncbi:DNA polymerase III subunit beta, partial [Pseudomonas sp. MWU12-2115]